MRRWLLFSTDVRVLAMQGCVWLCLAFFAALGALDLAQGRASALPDSALLALVTVMLIGFSGYIVFRCAALPVADEVAVKPAKLGLALHHAA